MYNENDNHLATRIFLQFLVKHSLQSPKPLHQIPSEPSLIQDQYRPKLQELKYQSPQHRTNKY